jgi:hypothetical protein
VTERASTRSESFSFLQNGTRTSTSTLPERSANAHCTPHHRPEIESSILSNLELYQRTRLLKTVPGLVRRVSVRIIIESHCFE